VVIGSATRIAIFALVAVGLAGCYYVVPTPPPPPGAGPAVPQFVAQRPQCRWVYGPGWHGWAWYSSVPC
jgi:hypothetical protein